MDCLRECPRCGLEIEEAGKMKCPRCGEVLLKKCSECNKCNIFNLYKEKNNE
ncbi:MAG: hypothetical protein ACOC5A_06895 [Halanaerobiales bacterium]